MPQAFLFPFLPCFQPSLPLLIRTQFCTFVLLFQPFGPLSCPLLILTNPFNKSLLVSSLQVSIPPRCCYRCGCSMYGTRLTLAGCTFPSVFDAFEHPQRSRYCPNLYVGIQTAVITLHSSHMRCRCNSRSSGMGKHKAVVHCRRCNLFQHLQAGTAQSVVCMYCCV